MIPHSEYRIRLCLPMQQQNGEEKENFVNQAHSLDPIIVHSVDTCSICSIASIDLPTHTLLTSTFC